MQTDVYPPSEDTYLLAEVLMKQSLQGKRVLEVGCGSGFLAALAAAKGAEVTAVDVDENAVQAAKALLKKEGKSAEIFQSDLFESVKGKFDLIIFNPPYLPDSDGEAAFASPQWSGGPSGRVVIERFVSEAGKFLNTGGKVLLLISSLTEESEVISFFHSRKFEARVIARKKLDWEELIVIEASAK
jgi:release factor glutamine methyltransferase